VSSLTSLSPISTTAFDRFSLTSQFKYIYLVQHAFLLFQQHPHHLYHRASMNATTDVGVTKAVREFEHGRQRAKKTERTAHYRAEKAFNKQLKAAHVSPLVYQEKKPGHMSVRGLRTNLTERADRDLESSEDSGVEEDYWLEVPLSSKKSDEKVEIDLTAIMQPAKSRKSKAGDFEVLPSVRSVVALDDKFTADVPMEIDEPWECIDADDESGVGPRRKTLSYADVLR